MNATAGRAGGRARLLIRGWVWVWMPVAIFAASRVVSTVLLLVAGQDQEAPPDVPQFPADPSFAELLLNFDGGWYAQIADEGYPSQLPRSDGMVTQNQWAFYPLATGLARLLMLSGIDFVWAASLVAMVSSAAACVVLFDLLRQRAGSFTASMGVATLVLGPVGLIFQTPYTDGLAMLLVLLALRCLGTRRWGRVAAYGLLLAFTRPIALALAAVCAITWAVLWWRRDEQPFSTADRLRLGAATAVVGAGFFAWPVVAALVTGEKNAYRLTQSAWLDDNESWTTWITGAFGSNGEWMFTALALLVLAIVTWAAVRRDAQLWPREARLWSVLYTLYILAATRPTTSALRYLTLAIFPSWPLPEVTERCRTTRSRLLLAVPVLALCVLGQWWWTSTIWVPHGKTYYP